ncbi:hypothetical protein DLAC_04962 [Tieghemostelium lacteum]|uniref:DUF1348 family protein n=1 Tax=Tieghemostelium lacteum TaxID=361077 RepID=A0A151ZI65_TIELA|nr:hypothetical protein DLAC_04962 [Tieghemostelium lacteum]|eukprot:KYQ93589.1 hypothetical protein DLAC_04962 [Tieghemostelium lacteum]
MTEEIKYPVPPFNNIEDVFKKVRAAEDAWNGGDAEKISMAYSKDSKWRNRSQFINGRQEIVEFLKNKFQKEHEYRLIKELWTYEVGGNKIAVRFAYEWHDDNGNWFRSYGNENWLFNENGLMIERHASINDVPIKESERLYRWPLKSPRPLNHPSLSELGL